MTLPKAIARVRLGYATDNHFEEIEVEIMSVNFNTGSVKVRFVDAIFDADPRITHIEMCAFRNFNFNPIGIL